MVGCRPPISRGPNGGSSVPCGDRGFESRSIEFEPSSDGRPSDRIRRKPMKFFCAGGGTADTLASGASGRKPLRVQIPLCAENFAQAKFSHTFLMSIFRAQK